MKKWYLHNLNTNVEFRRKGIDYTFGDEVNYGGILIKEVRDFLEKNYYIRNLNLFMSW